MTERRYMPESKYYYAYSLQSYPLICSSFLIYQISELSGNKDTYIRPHKQWCDEITYISSGEGYIVNNDIRYKVKKGDCFLSYNNEIHMIESIPSNPLHFYSIGFITTEKGLKAIVTLLKNKSVHLINDESLGIICNSIIAESYDGNQFCDGMINSYLEQFVYKIARKCIDDSQGDGQGKKGVSLVYQLSTYLRTHLYEPEALAEIGESFNYSVRTLNKVFFASTGESLSKCFTRMRMEKANELLDLGKTVSEISDLMGYSSIHPFSRAYKNYFGHPPTKR